MVLDYQSGIGKEKEKKMKNGPFNFGTGNKMD
jgi:hypothetical protein